MSFIIKISSRFISLQISNTNNHHVRCTAYHVYYHLSLFHLIQQSMSGSMFVFSVNFSFGRIFARPLAPAHFVPKQTFLPVLELLRGNEDWDSGAPRHRDLDIS